METNSYKGSIFYSIELPCLKCPSMEYGHVTFIGFYSVVKKNPWLWLLFYTTHRNQISLWGGIQHTQDTCDNNISLSQPQARQMMTANLHHTP